MSTRQRAHPLLETGKFILDVSFRFVRRRHGEQFHPVCVFQTVNYSTKVTICSIISGKGTGHLYVVKGIMGQDQYLQRILIKAVGSAAQKMVSDWQTISFYSRWSSLSQSTIYKNLFARAECPSVGLPGE